MGDLQFRSYLKLLLHNLQAAISKESKEEIVAALEEMIKDLEEDLRR